MIDTPVLLQSLVAELKRNRTIALDTEFMSTNVYVPKLALVQVGLESGDVHLIDAVTIGDLSPLGKVLGDENIVKILHDAGQDLRVLRHATGTRVRCVFDTRLAAQLLGVDPYASLSCCTRALCGVSIAKGPRRSNWLKRPLSPSQIEYAKNDVRYLHDIHAKLLRRARTLDRMDWLEEEMARFDDPVHYTTTDPGLSALELPGALELAPLQCAVLVEVARWRVRTAKKLNVPLKQVMSKAHLIYLAKRMPSTAAEVGATCRNLARFGRELAGVIKQAADTPPEKCPAPRTLPPLSLAENALLRLVQALVGSAAACNDISPELIATTSEAKAFVLYPNDAAHPLRRGWRHSVVGKDLVNLLSGRVHVHVDSDSGRLQLTRLRQSADAPVA